MFGGFRKSLYLCSRNQGTNDCNTKLGYGVMVTLQILVLPFLVRVRVSQQRRAQSFEVALFCLCQKECELH